MRIKRLIGGSIVAGAGLLMMSSPAFSAVTTNPTVVGFDGQTIAITATGLGEVLSADVQVCNNINPALITDASAVAANCAQQTTTTETNVVAGTLTANYAVSYSSPDADNGDIDWKCGPTGNADGTVIESGYRIFSTCQIRVNPGGTTLDTANDQFSQITFVADEEPEPVVPEAPLTILLPLGGAAVLGGSYFFLRRRPAAA